MLGNLAPDDGQPLGPLLGNLARAEGGSLRLTATTTESAVARWRARAPRDPQRWLHVATFWAATARTCSTPQRRRHGRLRIAKCLNSDFHRVVQQSAFGSDDIPREGFRRGPSDCRMGRHRHATISLSLTRGLGMARHIVTVVLLIQCLLERGEYEL